MSNKYDPIIGEYRQDDVSLSTLDARYLKTDQSTGNQFIDGQLRIGNATTYFLLNGNDLELWVHGVKRQSWTTTPVSGG